MKNQALWVAGTQELIGGLEELVSNVKDIQSLPRGYVITGQKDYLTAYNSTIPDIQATRVKGFNDLLGKANKALYKAKTSRRNKVIMAS